MPRLWPLWPEWPTVPSLMATTESVEREVVPLFGVPGPCSLGFAGSESGGGTGAWLVE